MFGKDISLPTGIHLSSSVSLSAVVYSSVSASQDWLKFFLVYLLLCLVEDHIGVTAALTLLIKFIYYCTITVFNTGKLSNKDILYFANIHVKMSLATF